MNPKVEKRRQTLINAAYIALLLFLFYLFMEYAFTLFFPFLVAFMFAMLLQKPINFITKKTPLKKGFVSCVLVLLLTGIVLGIIGVLVFKVFDEAKNLFSVIYSKIDNLPVITKNLRNAFFNRIGFLPDSIENAVREFVTDITDKIINPETNQAVTNAQQSAERTNLFGKFDFSILSKPLGSIWSTAKQIPSAVVSVVIAIISSCFMCMEYDKMVNFIKRQLSSKRDVRDLSSAKHLLLGSLKKIFRAYATIILITFTEIFIGLQALKLLGLYNGGYIFIIAAITAIVDIIPVLGTGTILIPWALVCFIIGSPWLGLGIAILYVCITVIRQIIEPKLVASNLGISPVLSIMGLYLGLKLFGVVGMLAMPIILTMIKLLNDEGIIHLWKTEKNSEASDEESHTEENSQQKTS